MLTKKEADNLMKTRGESRGVNIKIDLDYVLEKEGEEGLEKIETKMRELGYPLSYKKIMTMAFYPVGFEALVLLSVRDVFDLSEAEIETMGGAVVKFSVFMKVIMKYFGSLNLVAKEIPQSWKEHYTIGSLDMPEFSEKKKYAILRQKNFRIHPIYCLIHKGYFSKVGQMVVNKLVRCEEKKCAFAGDAYNEFYLTWE